VRVLCEVEEEQDEVCACARWRRSRIWCVRVRGGGGAI
jgi:hypothetical protein